MGPTFFNESVSPSENSGNDLLSNKVFIPVLSGVVLCLLLCVGVWCCWCHNERRKQHNSSNEPADIEFSAAAVANVPSAPPIPVNSPQVNSFPVNAAVVQPDDAVMLGVELGTGNVT